MFFAMSSCSAYSSLLLRRLQPNCGVFCCRTAPLLTPGRFAASSRRKAPTRTSIAASTKGSSTKRKQATQSRAATQAAATAAGAAAAAARGSKASDWPSSVRKSAARRAAPSSSDDGTDEDDLDEFTMVKLVEESLDELETTTSEKGSNRKGRAASNEEPSEEQAEDDGEDMSDSDTSRVFTTSRSKQRLDRDDCRSSGDEEDLSKSAPADDVEDEDGQLRAETAEESVVTEGDETVSPKGTDSVPESGESKYLAIQYPNLAEQYHPEKNSVPVQEVVVDSGKQAHWKCQTCSHEWKQAVFIRCVLRQLCPNCDLKKHPLLATAHPLLVREWDTDRNDPFIDPAKLPVTSNVSAHWICSSCRSPFEAKVKRRVNSTSRCPTCTVSTLQSSSISNELIRLEWHPVKNGDLSLQRVAPTTHAWWLCSTCGFEWEASVVQRLRVRKTGACPQCRNCNVAK